MRSSDTAARLAGDEFVLILEADILGDLDPIKVAEKLLIKLRRPFKLTAGTGRITASIGVVISDGAPDTAQTVLHDADIGMYKAKQQGKDGYFVVPRTPLPEFHI
ncbi:MAG TPA: GGDEF domain-containing protein [Rhodocyclaceae bacterium]|nr:GGDEF domain-containing protein [Rhodocyclaceae bacterium]